MQHISQILPRVLAKRGLQSEAEASLLLAKANQWLGEHLGNLVDDVRAMKIKDGAIILETKTAIATQEVFGLHRDLIAHLNAEMPSTKIQKIQIRRAQ